MDIRIIKTKRAIRSAFLELRKRTPLEKIKVVDICALAEINKTTFYKYYQDVLDLNHVLELEVFAGILETFPARDKLFTDPAGFIRSLPQALDAQGEILYTLYSDRFEAFFIRLEDGLREQYRENHPENISDITLTFIISGTVHMFREMKLNQNRDIETLATELEEIIRKLSA